MNFPNKLTFKIRTLGCKVNQYEEELIRENLISIGLTESGSDIANVYIVNSCTVTHRADSETRRLARFYHGKNPGAILIVTGCYTGTEEDRDALAGIKGVTKIFENKEKDRIPLFIAKEFGIKINGCVHGINDFSGHDRAFLKVQDGCINRCSYCKVSLVRGNPVSKPEQDVVSELTGLVNAGFKEIVLTGICLGAWGVDMGAGKDLTYLVERLTKVQGDFRIRLSSIEPKFVTDRLLELMANDKKLCKHLHVPLQSGDDNTLKLMDRGYTASWFKDVINRAKSKVVDVAFTTDVILGFPCETDETFANTRALINDLKPSRLHIFTYSKRPGTKASLMKPEPKPQDVKRWLKDLESLGAGLMAEYARSYIGKNLTVLVETEPDKETGYLCGYSDNYIKVYLSTNSYKPGTLASVISNITYREGVMV